MPIEAQAYCSDIERRKVTFGLDDSALAIGEVHIPFEVLAPCNGGRDLVTKSARASLLVAVFDHNGQAATDATVSVRRLGIRGSRHRPLNYSALLGLYALHGLVPGDYHVRVAAQRLEAQERRVTVASAEAREIFVLGTPDMPHLFRGRVRTPFAPPPSLIAVAIEPRTKEAADSLERIARVELGLGREWVSEAIEQQYVRVLRMPDEIDPEPEGTILDRLERSGLVSHAGRVVKFDWETVSFLTRELVVKFRPEVSVEAVSHFARQYGLEVLRPIAYAGNAFLMRWDRPATLEVLRPASAMARDDSLGFKQLCR